MLIIEKLKDKIMHTLIYLCCLLGNMSKIQHLNVILLSWISILYMCICECIYIP